MKEEEEENHLNRIFKVTWTGKKSCFHMKALRWLIRKISRSKFSRKFDKNRHRVKAPPFGV